MYCKFNGNIIIKQIFIAREFFAALVDIKSLEPTVYKIDSI